MRMRISSGGRKNETLDKGTGIMAGTKLVVAEEILRQFGGNRFIAMTGAKNFLGGDFSLSFHLPGRKAVRVELTDRDLYDVTFYKLAKADAKVEKEVEGVYAEDLRRIFEDHTGLRTSL